MTGSLRAAAGLMEVFMLDRMRSVFSRKPMSPRDRTARAFIRGRGIEIGALHWPLSVGRRAEVTYVDRFDVPGLRAQYPTLEHLTFHPVDVVDDGEQLKTFAAASQDFIIANHFIEHTQNPIGTIRRHLDVLKPGGILYMAVPEKDYIFDRLRPVTTIEHLTRDHMEGPAWSRDDHYEEYVRLAMQTPADRHDGMVANLKAQDYSIHFHCWTKDAFVAFLTHLIEVMRFPMQIEAVEDNLDPWCEIIYVLRKKRR